MKVVGAVGLEGSGKDTLIKYLHEQYGIPLLSMGDLVRDMADRRDICPTRANLHKLSQETFEQHGRDYFAEKISKEIEEEGSDVVGVTGIRTPTDVRTFRKHFGDDFILVQIKVGDSRTRFERVKQRDEARDPQTYKEFRQQEWEEKEIFHVAEAMKMADVTVENDGSLEAFYREIEQVVAPMLGNQVDSGQHG